MALRRSFFAVALAGAVSQFVLVGSALADSQVKISFLTHWAPETVDLLNAAIKSYEANHKDVDIEVRAVPFGDLLTTIRSQAGAADAPTIAGIYDLWLPELARDKTVAPAPAAYSDDVKKNWPVAAVDTASVAGTVYGYPNEIDLYALNYNKKLFTEAGISAPPKTWDELLEDAKKLTKTKGGQIEQQGIGLINSWSSGVVHPFAALAASNGGTLIANGKPTLASKPVEETFELYQKLVDAKVTDPSMGTADANTTGPFLDNFVAGKTAMIIMANWWESALKTGMVDSFSNIATAPIPIGPSGDASHSISYTWLTVVNASASEGQRKAAWDFLAWLDGSTSGKGGASAMGDILQSMGILPSRNSDVTAYGTKLERPFLVGYTKELSAAKPFPVVIGGQQFTDALQHHIEAIEFGKKKATEAAAGAQKDAEAILAKAAK